MLRRNLSFATGLLAGIIEATKDIKPNLIFSNAGYITAGFFHAISLERNLVRVCKAIS